MTADQLRASAAALVPPAGNSCWDRKRRELRERMMHADPSAFLRWKPVLETMVTRNRKQVAGRLGELQRDDWPRWQAAITEPWVGRPVPSEFRRSRGTLICQAYHLLTWERETGGRIDDLVSIVEFGGGYGAMALVTFQLGFRGQYAIHDFPEVALLQRYYLGRCGARAVRWLQPDEALGRGLLIAIGSIDEAPLGERARFLARVEPRHWLVRFQQSFEGTDNNAWIEQAAPDAKRCPDPFLASCTYAIR